MVMINDLGEAHLQITQLVIQRQEGPVFHASA